MRRQCRYRRNVHYGIHHHAVFSQAPVERPPILIKTPGAQILRSVDELGSAKNLSACCSFQNLVTILPFPHRTIFFSTARASARWNSATIRRDSFALADHLAKRGGAVA